MNEPKTKRHSTVHRIQPAHFHLDMQLKCVFEFSERKKICSVFIFQLVCLFVCWCNELHIKNTRVREHTSKYIPKTKQKNWENLNNTYYRKSQINFDSIVTKRDETVFVFVFDFDIIGNTRKSGYFWLSAKYMQCAIPFSIHRISWLSSICRFTIIEWLGVKLQNLFHHICLLRIKEYSTNGCQFLRSSNHVYTILNYNLIALAIILIRILKKQQHWNGSSYIYFCTFY